MMIDDFVDWHFDWYWFGNMDWNVFFHWYRYWFLHMVGHLFLHLVWYWFLNGDGDGLHHWHGHRLGDVNVDGIGLWHWYGHWFWYWYWNGMGYWYADVLVNWNWYWLGDLDCMGYFVTATMSNFTATSVAAFIMATVTARKAAIYGC